MNAGETPFRSLDRASHRQRHFLVAPSDRPGQVRRRHRPAVVRPAGDGHRRGRPAVGVSGLWQLGRPLSGTLLLPKPASGVISLMVTGGSGQSLGIPFSQRPAAEIIQELAEEVLPGPAPLDAGW